MTGRVIQGFFIGGGRLAPPAASPCASTASSQHHATAAAATPGRPALVHARASGPVQRRAVPAARPVPGRSPLVHGSPGAPATTGAARPLQRFGGDGSFAVDPARVGLVRSGGKPLPGPLLAKMEAALGADFSGVRVHVGPQAARIGALAFTTGNDLYFAPGQYQPDSVKGQQLIGHELAHVIQQRQGRVRAPGSGVAVVQDRALEAEADRLGMKAAAFYVPGVRSSPRQGARLQRKPTSMSGRAIKSPRARCIQRYTGNPFGEAGGIYEPVLWFDPAGYTNTAPYNRATFGKPHRPGWNQATVTGMFDGPGAEKDIRIIEFRGVRTPQVVYRCGACGGWGSYSEMQIGHIINWEEFVASTGPQSVAEAMLAYQDGRNLRLEHSTCNQSHDFEFKDSGGAPRKDDDDFIDDSEKDSVADAKAFTMLRAHLSGTSAYSTDRYSY